MRSISTSSQIQNGPLSIQSPVRDKRGAGDPPTARPCLLPTPSPLQPWHPGPGCGGSLLMEAPLVTKGKTDRRGRSSHKLHHLLFHLRVTVASLNRVSLPHPPSPHSPPLTSHTQASPSSAWLGGNTELDWIFWGPEADRRTHGDTSPHFLQQVHPHLQTFPTGTENALNRCLLNSSICECIQVAL